MGNEPVQRPETEDEIIDAFWRLYEEKSLDQISVKDISSLAGCNRSTFYSYFNNASEVLTYIEDRLIEKIQKAFFSDTDKPTYGDILNHQVDDFKRESRYLAVLLGENGDPQFAARLRGLFCYTEDDLVCDSLSVREATYVKEFIMGGFSFVMTKWFQGGCHSPIQEINLVTKAYLKTESKLFKSGL